MVLPTTGTAPSSAHGTEAKSIARYQGMYAGTSVTRMRDASLKRKIRIVTGRSATVQFSKTHGVSGHPPAKEDAITNTASACRVAPRADAISSKMPRSKLSTATPRLRIDGPRGRSFSSKRGKFSLPVAVPACREPARASSGLDSSFSNLSSRYIGAGNSLSSRRLYVSHPYPTTLCMVPGGVVQLVEAFVHCSSPMPGRSRATPVSVFRALADHRADGIADSLGGRWLPGRMQVRGDIAALEHFADGRFDRRGLLAQAE